MDLDSKGAAAVEVDNVLVISNNITASELWSGIGGHFDNYSQILCEFIDNSISNFLGNPLGLNQVIIDIENLDGNMIQTCIEDSGTGIKNLDAAFTIGSKAAQDSPMNEHGFGLKHALASANPENDNWQILTRTQEDLLVDQYKCISAPFEIGEYTAEIKHDVWPGHMNGTGTIVRFDCSYDLFKTTASGIRGGVSRFGTIIEILLEELGFVYAGAIKNGAVSIKVRYKDLSEQLQARSVAAVEPHWDEIYKSSTGTKLEGKTDYDLGGGPLTIHYKFGKIVESDYRKYYRCNQSSSGVEIRINGRMLENNIFSDIWSIERHNSYNSLLIQIDLESQNPKALPVTRTSKNGLRNGDSKYVELCDWIRSLMPTPYKNNDSRTVQDERELFEQIAHAKDIHLPEPKVVKTEMHAYSTLGERIRIDLYISANGSVTVYEGKKDKTTPKDVYQLLMYWDGLVFDGISPSRGVLISSEHPDSVSQIVQAVNQRKDAKGVLYNIELRTWQDEGLAYPSA